MEFFTKLLKINQTSRSPSPSPGPSALHEIEESVSEELSQTKERPKQGHDRKNKADHFYHNVGNLLRPTNESKTYEKSQSNTVCQKEEQLSGQIFPSRTGKSETYNKPECASCDKKQVIPQNNKTTYSQSPDLRRTLSSSPPITPESCYTRILEDSFTSASGDDSIKNYLSDAEAERDALNAMKSNIEVLAYLKKSESTEWHRENNEKYNNFITKNFNYQKITEDRKVKPTDLGPEKNGIPKVESRRDGLQRDETSDTERSVNEPSGSQNPIQAIPTSETIKSTSFTTEGSRVWRENSHKIDDKAENEESGSARTIINADERFSLLRLHHKNANSDVKSGETNRPIDCEDTFDNLNACYTSEQSYRKTHPGNLSRKTKKLIRQTAQTIDLSQDQSNQNDNSSRLSPGDECNENGKSLFNSFEMMRDQNVEVSSESNSLITADRRNSTKQSSLYIDKTFESNFSSPGPSTLIANDGKVNSKILVQECHSAQISKQIISPTSRIGCSDNANDPLHSTNQQEGNGIDGLDNPERREPSKFTIKNSGVTGTKEMPKSSAAELEDIIVGSKNLIENHTNLSEEREWVNILQDSENIIENNITINERPSTSENNNEMLYARNLKESPPRLREKNSKFEQRSGNSNASSFMNIYMKGEVGSTVKIEKIGDLYISDSSRKSSAKSLEEDLEGFSDCESKENDTDFESDSLERIDDGSASDSENEYDFDIEFVDDIEERLCGAEDTPTAEETIQEKIEKLLNSEDRGNDLIPIHEPEINIHAPPDYLTVQRPRNKRRSLRIRLSPVIEILEESLSPSILFDINDMPRVEDLDISLKNSEKLQKCYGRENVPTNNEKPEELKTDEQASKMDIPYLDEAQNDLHGCKNKFTHSFDSSLPSNGDTESQVRIMIYPAYSSPENQILLKEELRVDETGSCVKMSSNYNKEKTSINKIHKKEILSEADTGKETAKIADILLSEESKAESAMFQNISSTIALTGDDQTVTDENPSRPSVLFSKTMSKNMRPYLQSVANNMNATSKDELASSEFERDKDNAARHAGASCIQTKTEIGEKKDLTSEPNKDCPSLKKMRIQISNETDGNERLNEKESMNINKDEDLAEIEENELEMKHTTSFELNSNSGDTSEQIKPPFNSESKLIQIARVYQSSETAKDPFSSQQTHQKSDSIMKNCGPMSLKELCEATIYDDFENRNVDSLFLSNNEYVKSSNPENDEVFSDISCIDSFDEEVDKSISQDEEKECSALSRNLSENHHGKNCAMASNFIFKEEYTESTTEGPDILKSHMDTNKSDGEILDMQFQNELHKPDQLYETVQMAPKMVLTQNMHQRTTDQQKSEDSDVNTFNTNRKSLVPMKLLRENSDEPVNLNVRCRPEGFADNFILLKILEKRSTGIDNCSAKLNIPFMIASAQLERTPGISLGLTVNFPSESSYHSSEIPLDSRTPDLTHKSLYQPMRGVNSNDVTIADVLNSNNINMKALRYTSTAARPLADFPRDWEKTEELGCRLIAVDKNTVENGDVQKVLRSSKDEILVLKEDNEQMLDELRKLEKSKRNMEQLLAQGDDQDIPRISVPSRSADDKTSELKTVVREYEEIIAGLMEIVERDRTEFDKERHNLQKEVTELISHLNSLELAFNDIHLKYEKSKIVITGFKSNEELLKQCISDMEMVIVNHEKRYNSLKEYASSELKRANEELDSTKKNYEIKLSSYSDLLKKCETQLKSLQEIINMKMEENASLMKMCDDLIIKVSDLNH